MLNLSLIYFRSEFSFFSTQIHLDPQNIKHIAAAENRSHSHRTQIYPGKPSKGRNTIAKDLLLSNKLAGNTIKPQEALQYIKKREDGKRPFSCVSCYI